MMNIQSLYNLLVKLVLSFSNRKTMILNVSNEFVHVHMLKGFLNSFC